MSTEINNVAESLFEKIRSRFEDVSLGDENAKSTQTPEDARFFNFDYEVNGHNHGNITISLIDEQALKVYFSKNITNDLPDEEKQKWYAFLKELRYFAKRNMLTFEPRDITRSSLNIRDIKQVSHDDSTYDKDEVVDLGESRMYGSKKRSYESYGPVRIKIQHTKEVAEEVRGSRSRNISALFVENDQSERFKLPFTSLIGARAMARHVSAGGIPTDAIGEHITSLVNEMITLRPFVNAMRTRTFEDQETQGMLEAAFDYHRLLKHTLNKMKGKKGYNQFKENFKPSQVKEQDIDINNIKDKFVKRVMDERVEQALPLVHKAYQMMKENNNPFAKEFESWATRLSEGTWHIPETEEDIRKLAKLLRDSVQCGVDGVNGVNALGGLIGDDSLYDDIESLAEVDTEADCNSLIVSWLDNNMPEVLEQIKELSPDGFVRDQGREQEKPKDWAQAVAADESVEEDKEVDDLEEASFEITYTDPQFSKPKTHTIKSVNAKGAEEKFLSFGNPYKILDIKKVERADEGFDPDSFDGEITVPGLNNVPTTIKYTAEVDKEQNTVRVTNCSNNQYKEECQADAEAEWDARDADVPMDEGKMKDLSMDLNDLSDKEFEEKYGMKKTDWDEVKTPGLRQDPSKPAYISKNLKDEKVYEAHEKLEKLVGQRVYVKTKGETGTVDQVSKTHSNALVVDMDNGQTTVVHFTDLTSEDEKPSTLTRYLDMLKDIVDLHGRGPTPKGGYASKSWDAMEEGAEGCPCCDCPSKKECTCPPDCPDCDCHSKLEEEQYTDSEVQMAIRIANHMAGDMTDAYQAIEKISKGLGDHPEVADALKKANEAIEEMATLKRLSGLK